MTPEETIAKLPRWTQRNAARTVGALIASERQIHHKRIKNSDAAGILSYWMHTLLASPPSRVPIMTDLTFETMEIVVQILCTSSAECIATSFRDVSLVWNANILPYLQHLASADNRFSHLG
jgi:hypothetical protein